MTRLLSLARLRAPLGGQEIELQQLDHDGGGMSLLRTRIREGKRFTVFDIDPITAGQWGQALLDWVATQDNGAAQTTQTSALTTTGTTGTAEIADTAASAKTTAASPAHTGADN